MYLVSNTNLDAERARLFCTATITLSTGAAFFPLRHMARWRGGSFRFHLGFLPSVVEVVVVNFFLYRTVVFVFFSTSARSSFAAFLVALVRLFFALCPLHGAGHTFSVGAVCSCCYGLPQRAATHETPPFVSLTNPGCQNRSFGLECAQHLYLGSFSSPGDDTSQKYSNFAVLHYCLPQIKNARQLFLLQLMKCGKALSRTLDPFGHRPC